MSQEGKLSLVEQSRDHDPNLLEDGKDSLMDNSGNVHIFPLENADQHVFDLEKGVCWCLPEVVSEANCECNKKHPPFLIYHSWVM